MNDLMMMTTPKPNPALDSPLMTIGEVCAYVRFGETVIRNMIQLGEFPKPVRIRGRVYWHREQVERWLRDQFR